MVQMPATLLVVEVCCFLDEQLYNLHGVSILIHLVSHVHSNTLSITCPWVLDWEQRRSWIAIVKLDYCELSAIGIWESTFNERQNCFIIVFFSSIAKLIGHAMWDLWNFVLQWEACSYPALWCLKKNIVMLLQSSFYSVNYFTYLDRSYI